MATTFQAPLSWTLSALAMSTPSRVARWSEFGWRTSLTLTDTHTHTTHTAVPLPHVAQPAQIRVCKYAMTTSHDSLLVSHLLSRVEAPSSPSVVQATNNATKAPHHTSVLNPTMSSDGVSLSSHSPR